MSLNQPNVPSSNVCKIFNPLDPNPPGPLPCSSDRAEVMPDTIYIYDLVAQHNIYTSRSLAEILGYTADEIQRMGAIGYASLIHPEDLEAVAEHFQHLTTLLGGETITLEYRMRRADGTWCWLRSHETLLMQSLDGSTRQVLGIVQMLPSRQNPQASRIPVPSPQAVITPRSSAGVGDRPLSRIS